MSQGPCRTLQSRAAHMSESVTTMDTREHTSYTCAEVASTPGSPRRYIAQEPGSTPKASATIANSKRIETLFMKHTLSNKSSSTVANAQSPNVIPTCAATDLALGSEGIVTKEAALLNATYLDKSYSLRKQRKHFHGKKRQHEDLRCGQ
jgi:hypothetical protein